MTTTSRLTPPQALDLVSADRVRDVIAQADAELSALEREAAASTSAANEGERAVKAAGLDPEASAWTMVRLQRFLESLREETERDVDTMLELARQQARFRLSEAGLDDDVSAPPAPRPHEPTAARATATPPVVTPTPAPTPTPPPAPAPTPPVATPARDTHAAGTSAPRPSGSNRVALGGAAAVVVATELPAEPTVPHLALVDQPPVEASTRFAPAPAAPAAAPSAPAPTAAPVAPPAPIPVVPTPQPAAAPAAGDERKKKSRLRRLPLSAILEVIAVLLILVFILLRLS